MYGAVTGKKGWSNMADMKIGIVGAAGRMGGTVIRQVTMTDGCVVAAASEIPGSEAIGKDAGEVAGCGALGVAIINDAAAMFGEVDAVIEFSIPDATTAHAARAAEAGCIHIIGTTGLAPEQEAVLRAAGEKTPVVYAPNMSLAVNILFALTRRVAAMLDDDFDIEIVEMHHRHKVDAPSGTALGLGRAAAEGRNVAFDDVAVLSREGQTGERKKGDIGFATLRGGDATGDHTVLFAADGERLELSHKSSSRQIFARGAVRAALWAGGQKPGFYTMFDVLGLD
jgi:4-hydroxy-tetrahydrodipicolinate reductase